VPLGVPTFLVLEYDVTKQTSIQKWATMHHVVCAITVHYIKPHLHMLNANDLVLTMESWHNAVYQESGGGRRKDEVRPMVGSSALFTKML